MSYCRISDESDIYMYPTAVGIVCCSCRLSEGYESVQFGTAWVALEHLLEHKRVGHRVSLYAIKRLKKEIQEDKTTTEIKLREYIKLYGVDSTKAMDNLRKQFKDFYV